MSNLAEGYAQHWPVRRVTLQGQEDMELPVAAEEPLEIVLNGESVATLMRLPGDEKELVAGFCLTEGLVARFADILLISYCARVGGTDITPDGLEDRNRVLVTADPQGVRNSRRPRLIRSGCGDAEPGDLLTADLVPLTSRLQVASAVLFGLNRTVLSAPRLYKETGGLHAAAIFTADGQLIAVKEDIGRHNAVDKVIGYALLRGIPLEDRLLFTTGRASHEMVLKAVRAGIPVLASVSSPTSLAVELAQRLNCTLIGYLRGTRMNVYTHAWRVLADQAT